MTDIEKVINGRHFRVAIFGSARIKRGEPTYGIIKELASRIAESGMDVVTGGGPGLMNAASEGHYEGREESRLHSIGLTISLPKEQHDSFHLDIKKNFSKFSERLDNFMILSNAVVVAPGGVGTILEFFYTWQLVQVKHICNIPIILYGRMWEGLVEWIKKEPLKNGFLNKADLDHLYITNDCKEVMSILKNAHKHYKKDGKSFCLNYKKYKLKIG